MLPAVLQDAQLLQGPSETSKKKTIKEWNSGGKGKKEQRNHAICSASAEARAILETRHVTLFTNALWLIVIVVM